MHHDPNFVEKMLHLKVLMVVTSRKYTYGFTERHSSQNQTLQLKGYI